MARYLGIDIGQSSVRAVLLRTSYRRVALEGMGTCDLDAAPDLTEAIRIATAGLSKKADGVAIAHPGDQLFLRRLEIPATAQKQIALVVPFEIEAQIPFDVDDALYDFRALPKPKGAEKIPVLAAVAQASEVRGRVELLRNALGHEPEMVVPGSFCLANLAPIIPELAAAGVGAIVDLGAARTEVVLLVAGQPVFGRTLSAGVAGLPGTAPVLARELRQTFASFRALGGDPIDRIYLVGGGSSASGADAFLTHELGIPAAVLGVSTLEGMTPEQASVVPRFAKAMGLAMSLAQRGKTLNLRRGALSFERGFGFLREKVPILVGLSVVIVVSFLFSTWAEMRALSKENETLTSALETVTKDVLGETLSDPAKAIEVLEQGPNGVDEDPLPPVDAFDVMVQLADDVQPEVTHDLEELDVQKSGAQAAPHVTLHGVVPKVQDAEDLATSLKSFRCFQDVKIVKTTQQIGGEGQKYHMEFELKCPDDKKPKTAGSASAMAPSAPPPKEK